jgi:class 3 adenylate cyclase
MDRHDFDAVTAADIADAHLKDLEVQGQFGVRFLNYWFDPDRQTAFCLAEGPSGEAVEKVHSQSHGLIPNQVIEVDGRALERFMGGITNHLAGEPYVETAFRTILFTDVEDSTRLTQKFGDARAMVMLRTHDQIVQDAIRRSDGTEVKHTGDGLMAAFRSVVGTIEAAIQIQRQLADANGMADIPMRVRIGISAGEPVTESDDLFGAAVQLAARLCSRAEPGTILVSSAVRDLALGKSFPFQKGRRLRLKGFDETVMAFEVSWQAQA